MPSTGFVPQPLSLPPFAPRAAARISLRGKPLHCVPFPCRSLPNRPSLPDAISPSPPTIQSIIMLKKLTSKQSDSSTFQPFNPSTIILRNSTNSATLYPPGQAANKSSSPVRVRALAIDSAITKETSAQNPNATPPISVGCLRLDQAHSANTKTPQHTT
jgi:hypothetical protein